MELHLKENSFRAKMVEMTAILLLKDVLNKAINVPVLNKLHLVQNSAQRSGGQKKNQMTSGTKKQTERYI